MLELELIFLSRSVIFSSSRSTFRSILRATVAQLRQLAAPWLPPSPRGFAEQKPFSTVVVFYSSSVLCLLSLFQSIFAQFGLFLYLFF